MGVVHTRSAPLRGSYTGAELIERRLARHPDLVLVITHMGMPEYHQFAELAERYPGVHLETTLAFTRFAEQFFPVPESYVEKLGKRRPSPSTLGRSGCAPSSGTTAPACWASGPAETATLRPIDSQGREKEGPDTKKDLLRGEQALLFSVEPRRLELLTSCLQSRRSTN